MFKVKNKNITKISDFISDFEKNKNIKQMVSPYGDGHASQKIVKIIKTHFMQSEHIN